MIHQFDSAEYHLQNSLNIAREEQSEQLIWKNLNNLAVLYRIQGEYDKSLNCLREMMGRDSLDSETKTFVFLNMGNTFMAKGELDSAALFYHRLDNVVSNTLTRSDTKAAVYNSLMKYAESQGALSLALQYSKNDKDALYDVMSHRQEQAVYHIQKQYDYETMQNTMSKKIIRRQRFMLVFGLLSLVLSVIVLILQHRHNQLLKAEDDLKRKLNTMKEDLRQTVNTSVVDKMLVSQLRNIIEANRAMSQTKETKGVWRSLLRKVMAGQEDTFEAAKTAIEMAYPNLLSVIHEKHPELSVTEAKVCLMSCFDLTNAEIAELLGLSVNTVNQNRSTLRRKLGLGSEKMHEHMHDIIEK